MRRGLSLILIWCVITLIGVLIWKLSMARMIALQNPQKALELSPQYSVALIADNELKLRSQRAEPVPHIIKEQSVRALKRAPLSGAPITHVAKLNTLQGNRTIARDMLVLAKSRNIHDKTTLKNLISIDLASGNLSDAILNLDTLINLQGENLNPYYTALAAFYSSDEGRKIIDSYLAKRPDWGKGVLLAQIETMNAKTVSIIMHSVALYSHSLEYYDEDKKINEKLLSKLIELEAYEKAYSYWKITADQSLQNEIELIYDPNFNGRKAMTPFNWSLRKKQSYYAEIEKGGGLYLSFSDTKNHGLAHQILKLTPGKTYNLSVKADWDYDSRNSQFIWYVRCLPSWSTLSKIELTNASKNKPLPAVSFTIPTEGCTAQRLQLTGEASPTPARITARVTALHLSLASP